MTTLVVETQLIPKRSFPINRVSQPLIAFTALVTLGYLFLITFCFGISNIYLFVLVVSSQVFFSWQALSFLYTIWETNAQPIRDRQMTESVDVFIAVINEPIEVIERTLAGCAAMAYPDFTVHILNDGYAAGYANWRDIEVLANRYDVDCITRTILGGAKAGNINNGLHHTHAPFIAIFDADHVPHPDFLTEMMSYFTDKEMAFVQSPQYYNNFAANEVTGGAWEQQELFFGPICNGKNRLNAAPMCGTNMIVRRKALEEVGGFCETSPTEDFVTGLLIHQGGWKSFYVPHILAEGLAPQDLYSYFRQQTRWARGCLEVLFKRSPILQQGLTFAQKIQYLSSASYYMSGIFVLINAVVPLAFLFLRLVPFAVSTGVFAIAFLPYMFLTLYTIQRATNYSYTFRALSFSLASWPIHLRALYGLLTRKNRGFAVTSKVAHTGNVTYLVIPHLIYFAVAIVGVLNAALRDGLSAAVVNNAAWAIVNCAIFIPFVRSAVSKPATVRSLAPERVPALILIALAVLLVLSFVDLAGQSIRMDESQSILQARYSPSDVVSVVAEGVHVPLYHLILHYWQTLFGIGVPVARLLSLLLFLCSVPAIYILGKRALGISIARYATILFAISPFMNWYASEIRMYTAFTLITILSQFYFIGIYRQRNVGSWIGYCTCLVLGIFTHYFFIFVLFVHMIFYFLYRPLFPPGSVKRFIGVACAIASILGLWALYVTSLGKIGNELPALAPPRVADVFNVFSQFLFGFQDERISIVLLSLWPLIAILMLLALRRSAKVSPEIVLFALSVVIPIAVGFVISVAIRPMFLSRYYIFTLPSVILLIAWLFSTYPRRLKIACMSAMSVAMAIALVVEVVSTATPVKEDYRSATKFLDANATPQDIIILSAPFTIHPFDYYYRGSSKVVTLPIWEGYPSSIPAFHEEEMVSVLAKLQVNHERAFLLLSYDQGYEGKIKQYFDKNFRLLVKLHCSTHIDLYEYDFQ